MRSITTVAAMFLTLTLSAGAAAFDGILIPEFYEGPICLAYGPEPERFVFDSSTTGDHLEFGPDRIFHTADCSNEHMICDEYALVVRHHEVPDATFDRIEGHLSQWEWSAMYYWGDYAAGRDWVPADVPETSDPDFNLIDHMLYKDSVPGFHYHAHPGAQNDVMRWFIDTGDCFYMILVTMFVV